MLLQYRPLSVLLRKCYRHELNFFNRAYDVHTFPEDNLKSKDSKDKISIFFVLIDIIAG